MAEANRRRLLRLAGVLALVLAPRGVGVAALEHAGARPPEARLGSIPVATATTAPDRSLELEAPDLIARALRASFAGGWEGALPDVAAKGPSAYVPEGLAPLVAAMPAVAPVAEPPAALLLWVAAGGWLAARGSRQAPKRGGRFARNASMPSTASASSRLSAITAPASR